MYVNTYYTFKDKLFIESKVIHSIFIELSHQNQKKVSVSTIFGIGIGQILGIARDKFVYRRSSDLKRIIFCYCFVTRIFYIIYGFVVLVLGN